MCTYILPCEPSTGYWQEDRKSQDDSWSIPITIIPRRKVLVYMNDLCGEILAADFAIAGAGNIGSKTIGPGKRDGASSRSAFRGVPGSILAGSEGQSCCSNTEQ